MKTSCAVHTQSVSLNRFALLTFSLLMGVTPSFGQFNARLGGTVSDPSGAAIPEVNVTATNASTGVSRTVSSDASGSYTFQSLPPAIYNLKAEKNGFKSKSVTGVQLLVDQVATLDIQLEVGQVTTSVQVTGELAVVQLNSASISTMIGTTETTELPLNARRFGILALLTPSTITGLDRAGNGGRANPLANGTSYTANGGRSSGNNTIVDGVMNRGLSGGGFAVEPTPDAVQEFRIEANPYTAAYGMAGGAVITLVTKSGTNELHGSVYEFLRNSDMDARTFFQVNQTNLATGQPIPGTARGQFIRNQFGFALGGPIKKNKTFVFGNLEPLRQVQASAVTAIIPTVAQKQGNLSSSLTGTTANLCGAGGPANLNFDTGQLFDPATLTSFTCPSGSKILVGNPIPGNVITNIDTVSQKVLTGLYNVTPNRAGIPNYINNSPNSENDYIWSARVDHNISEKDMLFSRYIFGQSNVLGQGALPYQASTTYFRGQSAVLGWTHAFSPTLLQDARVGFQRDYSLIACQGCPRPPGTIASFGVTNLVGAGPDLERYPQFNFSASASRNSPGSFATYTAAGNGSYTPQWNPDMVETYQYHLNWTHGKHTIQGGADMSWWQSFHTQTAFAPNGLFFFDGRYSSLAGESTQAGISPIGDFLLGYPESVQRSFNFTFMEQKGGGFWNYFIQDDYKARPNLTINMGLRYEYYRPAIDKNGSYMSFLETGPAFSGPGNALLLTALPDAQNDALCTNPQYSYLTVGGRCLVATSQERQKLGFTGRRRQTIVKPDHDLFGPRLGISWRPTNSNRLVIHTGGGLFYDLPSLNNQHFGDNNPVFAPSQIYSTTFGAAPPATNGVATKMENVFAGPNAAIPPPSSQFVAAFLSPDSKSPRIQEWSFGIESQLGSDASMEIDYIGNHGDNLYNLLDFGNQPLPGVGPIQPRRPFPDFAGTLYTLSNANSWYQALQVKVTKKMAHGYSILGGYAWSKSLDDNEGDEAFTSGTGQAGAQDENNLASNKGASADDVRQRLVVSGIYELPFGNGKRFESGKGGVVGHLIGGWEASHILTVQTGFPLTVVSSTDFSNTSSPDPKPDRTCSGNGSRSISNFLNASCFTTAALQSAFQAGTPRFGNSGRGILGGPHYVDLDFALIKDTAITERVKTQLRGEFFNTLNTPTFGDPNTSIQSTAFGKITGIRSGSIARQVQLALKIIF